MTSVAVDIIIGLSYNIPVSIVFLHKIKPASCRQFEFTTVAIEDLFLRAHLHNQMFYTSRNILSGLHQISCD